MGSAFEDKFINGQSFVFNAFRGQIPNSTKPDDIKEEAGLFKKGDTIVILFPDHGSRYMSKIYSDKWMEEQGFFDSKNKATVETVQYIK
mgnify:CR=1 FL=1